MANTFRTSRIVAHTPQNMFNLVADVERYPAFVPLCERLVIRDRTRTGDQEKIVADMSVGYKVYHETFTSAVDLDHATLAIRAQYIDGPFRNLDNRWQFKPHARGCEVVFYISYEFRSRSLQMLVGGLFDRAFRKFSSAFEARANTVYGTRRRFASPAAATVGGAALAHPDS